MRINIKIPLTKFERIMKYIGTRNKIIPHIPRIWLFEYGIVCSILDLCFFLILRLLIIQQIDKTKGSRKPTKKTIGCKFMERSILIMYLHHETYNAKISRECNESAGLPYVRFLQPQVSFSSFHPLLACAF